MGRPDPRRDQRAVQRGILALVERRELSAGRGEADEAMAERVLAALHAIAARHEDSRVLVVTSGGPIRAVEAHLRGIDQKTARRLVETVDNCSLLDVVIRDGTLTRVETA